MRKQLLIQLFELSFLLSKLKERSNNILDFIYNWDYSQNGLNWGGNCAANTNQSPINIDKPFSYEVPSVQFHYSVVAGVPLKNNGINLYLQADLGYVKYKKDIFSAQQILFHSPSQHTFGSKNRHFDLQMQIIHTSVDQKRLIVSVLFTSSQDEPGLFLEKIGMNQESMKTLDTGHQFLTTKAIDLNSLLQNTNRYVAYQGSSSRPDCESPSTWLVILDTIKASKFQISNFPQKLKNASRAIQPRLDRKLRVSIEHVEKQTSDNKKVSDTSKIKDSIGNRKKIYEKMFWDNYLIEKQIQQGSKDQEDQRKSSIPHYDLDFPKFGVVSKVDEDTAKVQAPKKANKQQKDGLSKQQKELFKNHNSQNLHQIFNDKPDRKKNQKGAEVMNDGTLSKQNKMSFNQLSKQSQSQFMDSFINGDDNSSNQKVNTNKLNNKQQTKTTYSLLQLRKSQVSLNKLSIENIDYFHTNSWPLLCNQGTYQSPIIIKAPFYPSPNTIQLFYHQVKEPELQVFNDGGHKIVVRGNFGMTKFGSHVFTAVELNLHKPSEHTFGENGVHSAFEMQIISKDTAGGVMAVALLFDEKDDQGSQFLQKLGLGLTGVVPKLHQAGDRTKIKAEGIDLGKYIGTIDHFITYEGSLTSPPCYEGVQWFIGMKKFSISKMQLNTFQLMIGKPTNVRDVNGLNGRVLREI